MQLAAVASLDRPNQIANVIPVGQTAPLKARYRSKRGVPNCWPLGNCYIEQTGKGAYEVIGGVGHRRVVLHDDFLSVKAGTYGDTPWTWSPSLAGVTISQGASAIGGVGVAQIHVPAGGNAFPSLTKDSLGIQPPSAPSALHVSGYFAFSGNLAGFAVHNIGLFDLGAVGNEAEISVAGGAFMLIAQNAGGGKSSTFQATVPVDDTFFTFDLIVNTSFVSGWINADGPVTDSTHAPTGPLGPQIEEDTGGHVPVAAQNLYVDWIHVEQVSQVMHPSMFARSGAA